MRLGPDARSRARFGSILRRRGAGSTAGRAPERPADTPTFLPSRGRARGSCPKAGATEGCSIQSRCRELAQTLSLHRRTLSRRLRAQGTTFQAVLDEVRLEAARQLLQGTRTPIEEIAAALCYADVSAFTRAFRRWTGAAPGEWRRRRWTLRPSPARAGPLHR